MGTEEDTRATSTSTSRVFVSVEQSERSRQGQLKVQEEQLKETLDAEDKADDLFVPTLGKVPGNKHRVAMLKCIIMGSKQHITEIGGTLDIFLSKEPIFNKLCASVLLRLLTLLPQDEEPVMVMQENLVKYSDLLPPSSQLTPRQVEWQWAFKVLEQLRKLKFVGHLVSDNLKYLFASLVPDHEYK